MTEYTITENTQYNSREITFDGKPSAAVRDALKALKMRWHSVKKCWYGYASEAAIVSAILSAQPEDAPAEETATIYADGYLGGGAVYGSKSGKYLHGAELSAAIRADIKRAGIKGVSVSCKTYTGGQSIKATIKAPANYFKTRAEFVAGYKIPGSAAWIQADAETTIFARDYWEMDAKRQENVRLSAADYEYTRRISAEEIQINEYHIESSADFLNAEGIAVLKRVQAIICAYRYDASNSMVDYFDTNFYYDLRIKPDGVADAEKEVA